MAGGRAHTIGRDIEDGGKDNGGDGNRASEHASGHASCDQKSPKRSLRWRRREIRPAQPAIHSASRGVRSASPAPRKARNSAAQRIHRGRHLLVRICVLTDMICAGCCEYVGSTGTKSLAGGSADDLALQSCCAKRAGCSLYIINPWNPESYY